MSGIGKTPGGKYEVVDSCGDLLCDVGHFSGIAEIDGHFNLVNDFFETVDLHCTQRSWGWCSYLGQKG